MSDNIPENSSPRRLNYIKSKVSRTISPKNEESSTATNLKRIRKDTKKRNIDLVVRRSQERKREKTGNIFYHHFRQHLVKNLKENSHEMITKI